MYIYIYILSYYTKSTQIKVKKQLVVRKDIDINVHERLSSKTTQIKVKKQLVVRKDIDINVHERHGYKCTWRIVSHVHLYPCLSFTFISISCLTTSCFFTLICVDLRHGYKCT
jgi:hypothetical protein